MIEEIDLGDNLNYFFSLQYLSKSLTSLKISNISLREIYSYSFENLLFLDASFNNIFTLTGFHRILNLVYLDLKFNIINDIIISMIENFNFNRLNKLEYINLNKSLAKNLIKFELKFANKLEHAILSSNDLRIFPKFCEQIEPQEEIVSCNLKTLHFDHNQLEKLKQIDFHLLERLEFLNLQSNNIHFIDDNSFFNLKSLETLILSDNKINIGNNTQDLFNSLTNIKLLNLSLNFIEFIRVNTFSNLLKLEVLDLSHNKIHTIKQTSLNGLVNLRDLYINGNEPDLKIENSSFIQFESIKTIFLDKSVLNDSNHKSIFIDMVKHKNSINNKTIFKWIYYSAFNLITLNESFYDCALVFELIRFNIQLNLKTESDFNEYLESCQSRKIKS